ncbi:hypothetical protein GCM10023083_13090 [Streptomyces phyllanthi]
MTFGGAICHPIRSRIAHAVDGRVPVGVANLGRGWCAPLIQDSPLAWRREDLSSVKGSLPQLLIHLLHVSQLKVSVLVRGDQDIQCAVSPKSEPTRYDTRRVLVNQGHRTSSLRKEQRLRLTKIVSVSRRPGGGRLHLATHGIHFSAVRENLGFTQLPSTRANPPPGS